MAATPTSSLAAHYHIIPRRIVGQVNIVQIKRWWDNHTALQTPLLMKISTELCLAYGIENLVKLSQKNDLGVHDPKAEAISTTIPCAGQTSISTRPSYLQLHSRDLYFERLSGPLEMIQDLFDNFICKVIRKNADTGTITITMELPMNAKSWDSWLWLEISKECVPIVVKQLFDKEFKWIGDTAVMESPDGCTASMEGSFKLAKPTDEAPHRVVGQTIFNGINKSQLREMERTVTPAAKTDCATMLFMEGEAYLQLLLDLEIGWGLLGKLGANYDRISRQTWSAYIPKANIHTNLETRIVKPPSSLDAYKRTEQQYANQCGHTKTVVWVETFISTNDGVIAFKAIIKVGTAMRFYMLKNISFCIFYGEFRGKLVDRVGGRHQLSKGKSQVLIYKVYKMRRDCLLENSEVTVKEEDKAEGIFLESLSDGEGVLPKGTKLWVYSGKVVVK
ncbi:hypothetical protein GQ44DRAFT_724484 [Phaeosphaeriaceae sp. PMI808]|nr:hypothetical protein GQ44DRAFT_724484 [Phaeosphaeriaceae sp. PMI808]